MYNNTYVYKYIIDNITHFNYKQNMRFFYTILHILIKLKIVYSGADSEYLLEERAF